MIGVPAGFDPLLYNPGDPMFGFPGFDPFMGISDFDEMGEDPSSLHVVGNPFGGGTPTMREATLEDCVDDCAMCQSMRKQILAGNPPKIMAFE